MAERTAELESAHAPSWPWPTATRPKAIRYASLIQRVILPDRQLNARLHGQYFVVWQPRDVVGGDFYFCTGNETRAACLASSTAPGMACQEPS